MQANGGRVRLHPEGDAALIDQEKFDAIVEAVEELQGEPVLIFYQFTYEQRMLLERIPGAQPLEGVTTRTSTPGASRP